MTRERERGSERESGEGRETGKEREGLRKRLRTRARKRKETPYDAEKKAVSKPDFSTEEPWNSLARKSPTICDSFAESASYVTKTFL